jgi:hypothetical protein
MNFRIVAKFALLMVVFGFFMPISCDDSCFEWANYCLADGLNNLEGIVFGVFLYIMFISAIVGIILGILLLKKRNIKYVIDWIILFVCFISGPILWYPMFIDGLKNPSKGYGAYFILIGLFISVLLQIISKREKQTLKSKGANMEKISV